MSLTLSASARNTRRTTCDASYWSTCDVMSGDGVWGIAYRATRQATHGAVCEAWRVATKKASCEVVRRMRDLLCQ